MSTDVQGFLSNLPKWQIFFEGFDLPPAVRDEVAIGELRLRLGNIRRRLRDGPDAPMRLAFFGPTGAGKSKLFGSLIEDNFSGSGFKRPFTRRSFYYVHNDWKALVAALEGETSIHQVERWRDIILIDTPDFDSVETENRDEAERVFLECDGFLFVTDALKYADASTWEYLERIYDAGKSFVVVLNKVKSDTVSESFRERFERTLLKGDRKKKQKGSDNSDYTEVIVPEFRIDDATLIEADHESMQNLYKAARELVGESKDRQQASVEMLRVECESYCAHADELRTRITGKRTQIEEAKSAMQRRIEAAERRLDVRLSSGLEPAVRDDVYETVLKRLEKIDVLSYPRKLMAMPINGLRSLVGGWFSNEATSVEQPPQEGAFADPISSETFHLLESEIIAFADQSRNDIVARPGLEKLMDRETFRKLRYDHEELQQMYVEHHENFADWVATHAEQTASQITGDNKTQFVVSQVLFNSVLITGQVLVGGFNPIYDTAATTVISPMVAKGISMAIGSEKVKEFEEAAHAHHQESLADLLHRAKQRFEDYLEASCAGLDELEQNLNEISASRSKIDKILAHFQGIGGASSSITATNQKSADSQDGSAADQISRDAKE